MTTSSLPKPVPSLLRLSLTGLISVLGVSCSLPSREAWQQIRSRGLIPVLIDGHASAVVVETPAKPSEQEAVRVQPVMAPVVVRTPVADAVPGRPGYVYTPFTAPGKLVSVQGYNPGEEVRCPYTNKPFIVPAAHSAVAAVLSSPGKVTEVVSNSPVAPAASGLTPPALEPPLAPAAPKQESGTPEAPAADGAAAIPQAAWVPGRPGFVYSPFAAKTQLVDVAGSAPGVVVRCPYTRKMFRIPEVVTGEVTPVKVVPAVPEQPVAPATPPATPATPPVAPAPSPESPVVQP